MFSLKRVHAAIDGKKVKVRAGTTILEAARQAGIEIPTLCHIQDHGPTGVCRVCIVEVEGARTLVGSCHTPLAEGMVVRTNTPKVLSVRRAVVELMLTAHTGTCVNDPNADNCGLHNLASDHEVGAPRFNVITPRFYPIEDMNPYVRRDLSKCILCRRCITACREIAGKNVLTIGYRGFDSKVTAGYDEALTTDECRACGICIEYCPTGALSRPHEFTGIMTARPTKGLPRKDKTAARTGRALLLPGLKRELARSSHLSREAMLRVAGEVDLPLCDVFGVSSFYAYLPRRDKAVNRIRICKCVPCDLKGAPPVIGSLKRVLGIAPGETTPDGKFSLEVVSCIGACDQAPAMLINDDLFGHLSPEKIADILKTY
ncbi:MAG TPA: NAD(P)H-dependent oxidoreductase subunit E [Desulfomonilia bacterium]|nr:NAD(P)H-dependent oxidoreductase subunit E [Desulfomonilia bacterium]